MLFMMVLTRGLIMAMMVHIRRLVMAKKRYPTFLDKAGNDTMFFYHKGL